MLRSALVLAILVNPILATPVEAQRPSELELAPEVQAELLRAFEAATVEWIACGYGAVEGKRVRVQRLEWARMESADGNGATGTCAVAPDLVALAHPHLPRNVAGRENLCAASDLDRRAHMAAGVPVTLIVCEKQRYAFLTHHRGRERMGRFTPGRSRPSEAARPAAALPGAPPPASREGA